MLVGQPRDDAKRPRRGARQRVGAAAQRPPRPLHADALLRVRQLALLLVARLRDAHDGGVVQQP